MDGAASRLRIAIVVSEFNREITERMLEEALAYAEKLGITVSTVARVPGAFDIPLAVKVILERGDVDAAVTLGAIIKGETRHDEVIAQALAKTLQELAIRYGKPVTLGVSGPGMTWEQAEQRVREYAHRAVDAAARLVQLVKGLSGGEGGG